MDIFNKNCRVHNFEYIGIGSFLKCSDLLRTQKGYLTLINLDLFIFKGLKNLFLVVLC